jgi:hypothetical protein
MVNYDLPWNPNRLEQRFGRIHRIGQTEVCHLWNLVAAETREGEVYQKLLEKLDEERAALGGQVFDVLGRVAFDNRPLRELLIEAVRYGDQPEVRARLTQVVERAMDRDHLRHLLEERALACDSMDARRVQSIRQDMERADARRVQPHYIASFFQEAFKLLGGAIREREADRFEVTHVPALIRNRDRQIGTGDPVLPRYERVTFDQEERLSALPPVVLGGVLVVPLGLIQRLAGRPGDAEAADRETVEVERLAMEAVLEAERSLGNDPRDVSREKCGYDVESRVGGTGQLRFIEVKGRTVGADTICVTRNEILTALNKPEGYILAVVEVEGGKARTPRYIRTPFRCEPDFGVTSVNYKLTELLARACDPA